MYLNDLYTTKMYSYTKYYTLI